MALQRKLDELRLGAQVAAPILPGIGLADEVMLIRDLVALYKEARDTNTDGGAIYVADCCRRVVEGIGHLTVRNLAAPGGVGVLRAWRDKMWKDGWKPRSVRNVMNFARAVLLWGQSDGRALTGPLPSLPKFCRHGEVLNRPIFDTMAETDFRILRERCFEEALRTGGLNKSFPDRAMREDYVARRKLYLSHGFYTGAHDEDLNTLRGEYLSVDVGRYKRFNTKSARAVEPAWFDMPEQLQIDYEAELRRRDLPCFPQGDLPLGGPWQGATRMLAKATRRIWPDGSRASFTFQLARRSTVWEYTVRGWRTHEIAMLLGHVDETMVQAIYRHCSELGIISPVRVPWTLHSGPHGGPSERARTIRFPARLA